MIIADRSSEATVKRALGPLAIIGKAAVELLLKDAKYIKVDDSGYRLFEKHGRFRVARRDFQSVKPKNVKYAPRGGTMVKPSRMFEATGNFGNRRIQLRQNLKDTDNTRNPNVVITGPGEIPIKIIYMDRNK